MCGGGDGGRWAGDGAKTLGGRDSGAAGAAGGASGGKCECEWCWVDEWWCDE